MDRSTRLQTIELDHGKASRYGCLALTPCKPARSTGQVTSLGFV